MSSFAYSNGAINTKCFLSSFVSAVFVGLSNMTLTFVVTPVELFNSNLKQS